jgi:hypothetical protein
MTAPLLNDALQETYTEDVVLPYLNIALDDLQEIFALNNVPVTNEVTAALALPVGTTVVSFTSTPALPAGLVEIQQLWERATNTPPWVEMNKQEFIPPNQEDQSITQFRVWAWVDQEIRLISSTAANDIKIQYIQKIFNTPIDIGDVNIDIPVINIKQYLGYATASLCAEFIMEDEARATKLMGKANNALDRELGIPTKGRQSIITRRKPFQASYRRRGWVA